MTVKQGLVLLVLQLDYLEFVLAAHEAGQLDGSNHYHYKLSHFDKQSLVKVSARAALMKKSPLHHLWYLMPKKHMLFLYWIIQYCAIHTIHAILVYWANAANNTNGFVFYLFQFRVKNQKDWYQTLFPTHEDIWPFDSPVNTTVHILLEIPPSHELYFFWITLINELGGWFWLIITSGGSETTGTSDD